MLNKVIIVVGSTFVAFCSGELILKTLGDVPISRVSPEPGSFTNQFRVYAPDATQTLYPDTDNTPYAVEWFTGAASENIPLGGFAILTAPGINDALDTLAWKSGDGSYSESVVVSVSCSDGIHCNGEERWNGEVCATETNPVYQIGSTIYQCQESERRPGDIVYTTAVGQCGPQCVPQCNQGRKCGPGGCRPCGVDETPSVDNCASPTYCEDLHSRSCDAGEVCDFNSGQCVIPEPPSATPGTCQAPFRLFGNDHFGASGPILPSPDAAPVPYVGHPTIVPEDGILVRIEVDDTSTAENNLLAVIDVVCNAGASKEYLYEFELTNTQGFRIDMTNTLANGLSLRTGDSTAGEDPLLALHGAKENGCLSLGRGAGPNILCTDDSSPPGGYSSSIHSVLEPGNYTLVTSTFLGEIGPHVLFVTFTGEATKPSCDGFCGDDSAGGTCGYAHFYGADACDASEECAGGACLSCASNASSCNNKQCGFDECGRPCGGFGGSCKNKRVCDGETQKCKPVKFCDPDHPVCSGKKNGRGDRRYCGTDCEWHDVGSPQPDLVVVTEEEFKATIRFGTKTFTPESCAVAEGTIDGAGETGPFVRPLMFFASDSVNAGNAPYYGLTVDKDADSVEWGECHQHLHNLGYGRTNLYTLDGEFALPPIFNKRAFCLEDTFQYLPGGDVSCVAIGNCADQVITPGWVDVYGPDLDGQWQDLNTLPGAGWYLFESVLNDARIIHERTHDNNRLLTPVYIDPIFVNSPEQRYFDLVAADASICASLPTGYSVIECA